MKLAILGTDADILQLATAARAEDHEIVWVGDVRPTEVAAMAEIVPGYVDRAGQWELLLDRANADAVLIGRGTRSSELRAEQLKRLAAEAVPMLVVQPILDSVLPYYEVDMVRHDTGGIVRHYNPIGEQPILEEMAQWVVTEHPNIGAIQQISCERRVADTSRESVLGHLARDVEIVAAVAGDIRRVSAIGPALTDTNFAALQIQMTATNTPSVSWSVRSVAAGGPSFEMTLSGQRGSVRLAATENNASRPHTAWTLAASGEQRTEEQQLPDLDIAGNAIRELADALSTERKPGSPLSTWDTATRAMEVVDAVEISLQKGRTIEVIQQQLTERLAFRGTMAALGCGLLLVVFMTVLFITLLGGAEGLVGQRILPSWPLILLAVLAFFLLLQAVPFLAQKPRQDRAE